MHVFYTRVGGKTALGVGVYTVHYTKRVSSNSIMGRGFVLSSTPRVPDKVARHGTFKPVLCNQLGQVDQPTQNFIFILDPARVE